LLEKKIFLIACSERWPLESYGLQAWYKYEWAARSRYGTLPHQFVGMFLLGYRQLNLESHVISSDMRMASQSVARRIHYLFRLEDGKRQKCWKAASVAGQQLRKRQRREGLLLSVP